MADGRIQITVDGAELAQDVLAKVSEAMGGVSISAAGVTETAHTVRDALTEAFENPMGALQSLGTEIERSLGPLGAIGGAAAVAIGGATAAVVELGVHGAEVNDVAQGFRNFAGSVDEANTILAMMREGVHGTIADFALETDALHLMAAGVHLAADDFGTLSQASLVLAHEGFGTTKEILDQLTQSMITGRTRTIERMTGVLDAKEAEGQYASSLGVSSGQLDKAGQTEAKRLEILERLRQVVDHAGVQELSFKDRVDQMHTSMTNANDALGVAVATSPVLQQLLGAVGEELTDVFGTHQVDTIRTLVGWIDQGAIALVGLGEDGLTAADYISHAWNAMKLGVSGSMSVIAESALLTVRAYQAVAELGGSDVSKREAANAKALGDELQAIQGSLHADAAAALAAATGHTAFDDTIAHGHEVLEGLRLKLVDAAAQEVTNADVVNALGHAHDGAGVSAKSHQDAVDKLTASLAGTSEKSADMIAALLRLSNRSDLSAEAVGRMQDAITKLEIAGIDLPEKLYDWDAAHRELLDAWVTSLDPMAQYHTALALIANGSAPDYASAMQMATKYTEAFVPGLVDVGDQAAYANSRIHPLDATLTDFGIITLPNVVSSMQHTTDWVERLAGAFEHDLGDSLNNIPRLMTAAFTGGGGLSGAVKGIGSDLGGDLGRSIVGAIPGSIGELGDTLLPGIGGALGSVFGSLLGKIMNIGGPSQAELSGRQIEGTFEKSFGTFNDMAKAIGDAYAATGRSAQQANTDILAMMAAEKAGAQATQDSVNKINDAFTEQKQDAADLQTAIQKYGFTIDELGPTMQRQQLSQQVAGLENDFRLLAGSGIDVNTVLGKMGGSINDFIHLAQKTGSEVPSEMQPILQKMIDMGTLTDQNGNKITSLDGIGLSFSETMTQGFQKVVDKLDEFMQKIGLVPAALEKIPTSKDITLNAHIKQIDDGGDGTATTSFANEAFDISRPVIARVGDSPTDSESVLHAHTVKDIVAASRNAGAAQAASSGAAGAMLDTLKEGLSALTKEIRSQRADFSNLPMLLKHAMRGA